MGMGRWGHPNTLHGGFSGEWLAEAGDLTPQQGKLRLVQLKAKKPVILMRVSNELIADSVSSADDRVVRAQPARPSSVLRVRVAGSGTAAAKEPCQGEVTFIAFVWDLEEERRERVVSSERKL